MNQRPQLDSPAARAKRLPFPLTLPFSVLSDAIDHASQAFSMSLLLLVAWHAIPIFSQSW